MKGNSLGSGFEDPMNPGMMIGPSVDKTQYLNLVNLWRNRDNKTTQIDWENIYAANIANNANDPKLQRESKRMFQAVNIVMDESSGVAQRVELIEKNGDTTIIEFSNVVAK